MTAAEKSDSRGRSFGPGSPVQPQRDMLRPAPEGYLDSLPLPAEARRGERANLVSRDEVAARCGYRRTLTSSREIVLTARTPDSILRGQCKNLSPLGPFFCGFCQIQFTRLLPREFIDRFDMSVDRGLIESCMFALLISPVVIIPAGGLLVTTRIGNVMTHMGPKGLVIGGIVLLARLVDRFAKCVSMALWRLGLHMILMMFLHACRRSPQPCSSPPLQKNWGRVHEYGGYLLDHTSSMSH